MLLPMDLYTALWWANGAFLVLGSLYYVVKIVSQQPNPTTMQPCQPIRPAYENKEHKLKYSWKLKTSEASVQSLAPKDRKLITGSLIGRQVWEPRTQADGAISVPSFNPTKNQNSADLPLRLDCKRPLYETPAQTPVDVLKRAAEFYGSIQCDDGHWAGDYGGPMFLLPGAVIAWHIIKSDSGLDILGKEYTEEMITYLTAHQQTDGGWGLHTEGRSTMFGTVMNYVALRLLGVPASDPRAVRGREFIQKNGGASGVPAWGKFYLAVAGLYDWEGTTPTPPEAWILPNWFPFHPGKMWCHCRMVYLPMSYIYGGNYTAKITDLTRELRQELYTQDYDSIDWPRQRTTVCPIDVYAPHNKISDLAFELFRVYNRYAQIPYLRRRAMDYTLRYIRAEDKQTNHVCIGPVNKVLNMLSCWFAERDANAAGNYTEEFRRHAIRMKDYLWVAEDGMKMQGYNGSQLWDTAFAAQALLTADRSIAPEVIPPLKKAFQYIKDTQIARNEENFEYWYRVVSKGGWPFSTGDHGWPITDCSAEGLKVAVSMMKTTGVVPESELIGMNDLEDCVNVVLNLQNKDGGWASYEDQRGGPWYEAFNPAEVFGDIMIDYSYVECSAACLNALKAFQSVNPSHRKAEIDAALKRGGDFIRAQQRPDGSFYGSWAVCMTYGTWFGVKGLLSTGERVNSPRLRRVAHYIMTKQRPDGGWGEDVRACATKQYEQIESNVVNTSWALLALMMTKVPEAVPAVKRGISFLQSRQTKEGDFPQDTISGIFNRTCGITYTAYRNIFPIWALAMYTGGYSSWAETQTMPQGTSGAMLPWCAAPLSDIEKKGVEVNGTAPSLVKLASEDIWPNKLTTKLNQLQQTNYFRLGGVLVAAATNYLFFLQFMVFRF